MALIYRAVWEDDWCEPVLVLDDEFKAWCASKNIEVDDIPRRGSLTVNDRLSVEVRRADTEAGAALRCTLREVDGRGRVWTTTATAMTETNARTFWVDLDCEDPSGASPELAAPRLVRALIDNGGRPTSFGMELRTSATVLGPADADGLVEELLDPARLMPIVVFSPDPAATPDVTVRRANATAETLAGLAHVYAVSPHAVAVVDAGLPPGFRVFGGAVRLYLPGLDITDPDDAARHRWVPLRLISAHPRRAASLLSSRLARLQLHPPIPDSWPRLAGLLRQPSEAEVGARAEEISQQRGSFTETDDAATLRREVEELTKLLAEADLMRQAAEETAQVEVKRLQLGLVAAEVQQWDDAEEVEALHKERDALLRMVRALARGDDDSGAEQARIDGLPTPATVSDAVDAARTYLPFVTIPEAALRDIDDLEATGKYAAWASSTWRGLIALNDYAAAKASGQRPPGFKLWCDSTSAFQGSKVAMTESDSVMNNLQLREQRRFPVAVAVEPSGRIVMFAHLKIQVGGGDNIPRLYFYDDTDGPTGRMHVGFIGPHRHVRNTKS